MRRGQRGADQGAFSSGANGHPLEIGDDGRGEAATTVPGIRPDVGECVVTVYASAATPETVVARASSRSRDRRLHPSRTRVTNPLEPLESLQAKARARADSRTASDGWGAHEAVLDRLAANVRVAQAYGWTSCAIERVDDAPRFSAWGVPPSHWQRHPIPDWCTEPEGYRTPHSPD